MAVNKVVINNTTVIDLTADTVDASDLVSGVTAHAADGTAITGSLIIQHYYTGSSAPLSSLGINGDIYLQA